MIAAAHPPDEARRLRVLHALDILDTPSESAYDTLIDAAARLTGCPIALVSLVDERRQWFKAVRGLDTRQTPREWAFCAHAILEHALLEVPDATLDERFADNPLVTGAPHIRFYAGAPLEHRGMQLGTLCVIDQQPRELDDEQRTLLTRLAAVAGELIDGRARLAGLREERARLADLSRASGDWLWELDTRWRYRWVSGDVEAASGLAADAWIGRCIADAPVLDAAGAPSADGATLHALLRAGAPLRRVVCAEDTPRGALKVSHSAVPLLGADGQPRGWRGSSRDVGAQFAAEALRRDKEAAEQADRAKSELLSRVSHELRTPLNSILGFAQLMALDADAPLVGEQRRRLDGVRASGARLLELIDDLLELRLAAGAPADVPAGSAADPEPSPRPQPPAGARVLYIEDEPLNVLLMQEVFRGQPQWRLEVATDGTRGLEQARALRPDLLLIDMNLPDIGGLELIARLRADPLTADIACVALSADAMREQIESALTAGFDDYWTKPIDIPRLLGALADRLQRGRGPVAPSKKPA